ncbi:MAG: cation:proton antiporter [Myxococcales bacterium]|nr:cation:proton antiporter [Myxococcales bacterium]
MQSTTVILAALAALVFVGLALEELFRRTGIPDVLGLLAIGFVVSATGLVDLGDLQGVAPVFTTTALVLILFEGAVRLTLSELRSALRASLVITLVNFVLTTAVVAVVALALFPMRPLAAVLLGAILGGTSSAVVIPMVQNLKVSQDVRTALSLESALSDVLCIVFALALVGALSSGGVQWGEVGLDLAKGFGGAVALGVAAAGGWVFGLRALRQKRASLVVVGAAVFIVYALAEALSTFGAIAVLSFGVVLGNAQAIARRGGDRNAGLGLFEGERVFLSEMAFLLKVFFFVYLGIALKVDGYEPIVFGGVVTIAFFAVRPLVVRVSLPPARTSRSDAVVASALVPKGLAAAVLASVPAQAGISEGKLLEAIVFGCVLFSIPISSALVLFARRPFVSGAYERFFRRYREELPPAEGSAPASAPAAAPAETGEPA